MKQVSAFSGLAYSITRVIFNINGNCFFLYTCIVAEIDHMQRIRDNFEAGNYEQMIGIDTGLRLILATCCSYSTNTGKWCINPTIYFACTPFYFSVHT